MTKKKRRRPSRQQTSKKRGSAGIFSSVIWLVRVIYILLEIWDLLRTASGIHYLICAIRCRRYVIAMVRANSLHAGKHACCEKLCAKSKPSLQTREQAKARGPFVFQFGKLADIGQSGQLQALQPCLCGEGKIHRASESLPSESPSALVPHARLHRKTRLFALGSKATLLHHECTDSRGCRPSRQARHQEVLRIGIFYPCLSVLS